MEKEERVQSTFLAPSLRRTEKKIELLFFLSCCGLGPAASKETAGASAA